ncbi:MAG TPA: citrate/2-methylcitrate synthase [Aestuariivirgaceae bacterium]|nr:citrate/2-methylcitrate synthase [Aestuariivirgaceae bacterium]
MSDTEPVKVHRGLKGIYFERSGVSYIDGKAGELFYRGYSIHDLARHSTFEETAYLLLHGELPAQAALDRFKSELGAARRLPEPILGLIDTIQAAHPMAVLRTAVSALAAFDPDAHDDSFEAVLRKGLRLTSQAPMIVAAHDAIRNRHGVIDPDPELSHAGNFLWMLSGKRPSVEAARLLDMDLILHAEHGSNASSFAARVVIGTKADLHAAMTAALAALSGPAHGGAAEDVMRMAGEIAEPERAADYVRARRKAGEPVTGFGHRVYRTEDPRARHMRDGVAQLSAERGEPKWLAILEAVVAAMAPYARFGVNVNVDFYSGVGYRLLAIPPDLFVPVFAMGRIPGWTVQCLEQQANNILIRPLTLYDGPQPRPYVPLQEREKP